MSNFLFSSKCLLRGSGRVTLSMSPEVLEALIDWRIDEIRPKMFYAVQSVEVPGLHRIENSYTIMLEERNRFSFELESTGIGKHSGIGIYSDQEIVWRYTSSQEMQGYEIYREKEPGIYEFEAQYDGGDGFTTSIEGLLSSN